MYSSICCFRMHCWFFIRTQDQQTTYQFLQLLLTTWVKFAKQVQMFLKSHHQHISSSMTLKAFSKVAMNTFLINSHFLRNCFSRSTLHKHPEHTDRNWSERRCADGVTIILGIIFSSSSSLSLSLSLSLRRLLKTLEGVV